MSVRLKELLSKTQHIFGKVFSKDSAWEEIYIAPSKRPEPVFERLYQLQAQGIRCKLYNLNSPSGRGIYAGTISLRVHPDDVTKAKVILKSIQERF